MAEPRRIIPSRPSAQRLSDDIGDVLGAIRRLIAEDEALTSARDRLHDLRDRQPMALRAIDNTPPDPGEALARRHGGNAALARALAGLSETRDLAESVADVQTADAPPPDLPDAPADDFAALMADADHGAQNDLAQNDLARRLSATFTSDGDSGPLRLEQPLPVVEDRPVQGGPVLPEAKATAASPVDFDENFDWKAHMRPDFPPEPALDSWRGDSQPAAPEPADDRAIMGAQAVDPMNEEETIREWVREIIREELLGELGQRFSRNLRSLIRREVAVTIDDQLDRL